MPTSSANPAVKAAHRHHVQAAGADKTPPGAAGAVFAAVMTDVTKAGAASIPAETGKLDTVATAQATDQATLQATGQAADQPGGTAAAGGPQAAGPPQDANMAQPSVKSKARPKAFVNMASVVTPDQAGPGTPAQDVVKGIVPPSAAVPAPLPPGIAALPAATAGGDALTPDLQAAGQPAATPMGTGPQTPGVRHDPTGAATPDAQAAAAVASPGTKADPKPSHTASLGGTPLTAAPADGAFAPAIPAPAAPAAPAVLPFAPGIASAAPAPEIGHVMNPAAQLGPVLVQVVHTATPGGTAQLTIRLDPIELGAVSVQVHRPHDGPPSVTVTVERPDTLRLLLHDQPQLERTLDAAGVPAADRSLVITLAAADVPALKPAEAQPTHAVSPSNAPADLGGGPGSGAGSDGGGNAGGGGGRPGGRQPARAVGPDVVAGRATLSFAGRWLRAGIDITA